MSIMAPEQDLIELVAGELHFSVLLSLGINLLSATLILIAAWVIGRWLGNRVKRFQRLDATLTSFFSGLIRYIVMIVALITVLAQFGVQTASLLAVLGAAGLALGLALQGTLSNVAAGVMLLILRPFKVGDAISAANGKAGTVKSLGLFGTELSTADNVYVFIPNGQIWNNDIWNYSRNAVRRQDILFGISYNDDIGKAIAIVEEVLAKDPRVLRTPDDRKPEVLTDNMGDFSINMIARFWSNRADHGPLRKDITKAIKEALDSEGITIPFPTQTLEVAEPVPPLSGSQK